MREEDALVFFGLPPDADKERIRDAYEHYCFEVRQKALMNLAVPRIMKKRSEALANAKEAYATLLKEEEGPLPEIPFDALTSFDQACELLGTIPPWSTAVRIYEQRIGSARLKIANSFTAVPLAEGISTAMRYQQAYHCILYEAFTPIFVRPEAFPLSLAIMKKDLKAGQAAYTGTLIQELEELEELGLGRKGVEGAAEMLENLLPKKEGLASRLLNEIQRIHQLGQLDEKKKG